MTPYYAKFLIAQSSHTIAQLMKETHDTRANDLAIQMQVLNIHSLQSYWGFSDDDVQKLISMPLSVIQKIYRSIREEYDD